MNIETLINATPHAITERITDGIDGVNVRYDKTDIVARVDTPKDLDVTPQDYPIADGERRFSGVRTIFTRDTAPGQVVGLPDPVDGVVYIVSGQVLAALAGIRSDVIAPATDPRHDPIRNEKGHIVAVRGFVRNP